MSLGAHHLLHRSCRGKAHASGIAKRNNRLTVSPSQRLSKSPFQEVPKQESSHQSNGVPNKVNRKHGSRNSTSSWECSDTDSIHSSEIGSSLIAENRTFSDNSSRSNDRISSARINIKDRIKGSHGSNHCTPLSRTTRNLKKQSWADTLRDGSIDDRFKRMEEGWDDSNVIRTPKERKWHRITAEIEQRLPNTHDGLRIYGIKNSSTRNWSNNSKKLSKRNRTTYQRCVKPIYDIIDWQELFEMALARKVRRKIQGKGKADGSNVTDSVKGGRESDRAKDERECMKRLEVLLENRVSPQIDKVCLYQRDI